MPTEPELIARIQKRKHIPVPKQLALHAKTAAETILFTRNVTESICAKARILLDFSQTQSLTAVGAVICFLRLTELTVVSTALGVQLKST